MADSAPKPKDVLTDPILKKNPIALLTLGICSALAVTTKLETALVMSIAVVAVTGCSSFFVSLIQMLWGVPSSIRIIVQMTVIALILSLSLFRHPELVEGSLVHKLVHAYVSGGVHTLSCSSG